MSGVCDVFDVCDEIDVGGVCGVNDVNVCADMNDNIDITKCEEIEITFNNVSGVSVDAIIRDDKARHHLSTDGLTTPEASQVPLSEIVSQKRGQRTRSQGSESLSYNHSISKTPSKKRQSNPPPLFFDPCLVNNI